MISNPFTDMNDESRMSPQDIPDHLEDKFEAWCYAERSIDAACDDDDADLFEKPDDGAGIRMIDDAADACEHDDDIDDGEHIDHRCDCDTCDCDDEDDEYEDDDDDGSPAHPLFAQTCEDFHNRAVEAASMNLYSVAIHICREGLELHPNNLDLLADIIAYSCKIGNLETAQEHYEKLSMIPHSCWNWRAFSFAFDYLVLNPIENESLCRELIADYKRYMPHLEKAYSLEHELETQLGNHERSLTVLKELVSKTPNAPICALKLTKEFEDRGLHKERIAAASYGVAASCSVQPTANVPYLALQRALGIQALIYQRLNEDMPVPVEEIDSLIKGYEFILDKFPELRAFEDEIRLHINMLELEKIYRRYV